MVLADEYCQTGLREVTGVLQSQCLVGVNSAVEGQRVKLRFAGASCQSEQPWSSVAMVTSEVVGRPHEVSVPFRPICSLEGPLNVLFLCFLHFMEKFSSMSTQSDSRAHL